MAVAINENDVQRWDVGLKIANSADVSAACNCVLGNKVGVDHKRDLLPTTYEHGINRLRQNNFQNDSLNVIAKAGVATPGNPTLQATAGFHLGVSGESTSGQNRLRLGAQLAGHFNYRMETGVYGQNIIGRVDSAYVNNWYNAAGTLLGTVPDIQALNSAEAPQVIEVDGFNPGDPSCSTQSSDCDISGLSAALAREGPRGSVADVERDVPRPTPASTAVGQLESLPTVFRLGTPRPTPASSGVVVDLDVPSPGSDPVDLAVYDVRGRRVRVLQHGRLEAGRHAFAWDLRDKSDARIAAGVYFVRVISPRYTRVEKLVVLR